MSDTALIRFCGTRESAHLAARDGYAQAQLLLADGKRVRFEVAEAEDEKSIAQRGFLHAAVLRQISEQVRVEGVRYTPTLWKEHLKDLFIPDAWDMVRLPFVRDESGAWVPSTESVPVKRAKHTEDLGLKAYSEFIDACIQHATVEWGVVFRFRAEEREAARYVAPVRHARQQQPEKEAA